jgi:hypothetical protein
VCVGGGGEVGGRLGLRDWRVCVMVVGWWLWDGGVAVVVWWDMVDGNGGAGWLTCQASWHQAQGWRQGLRRT